MLNNKGFAVSVILYSISALIMIILLLILAVEKTNINNANSITDSIKEELVKNTNYVVTFDANGGSVPITSATVTANREFGPMPTPTKKDYIFDGWYTEINGGTKYTETSIVDFASDITLYAKWSTMAELGEGTPKNAWDGNVNTMGIRSGNSGPLYIFEEADWVESDYKKFLDKFVMTYTFTDEKNIGGVTIVMPSKTKAFDTYNAAIIRFEKVYTAKASVYVDDLLYCQVDVSHKSTQSNFTCDFGQTITGKNIKVVFSRNTYAAKGGQWWENAAYDDGGIYWFAASYSVFVNEIIVNLK